MKRLALIIAGVCAPATAFAVSITQYGWDCSGFLYCGSNADAVQIITTNITVGVVGIIVALAVIAFLYGAIRIATSQGGEGKEVGKKAIIWACIGLVCALLCGAVITFVQQLIFAVS